MPEFVLERKTQKRSSTDSGVRRSELLFPDRDQLKLEDESPTEGDEAGPGAEAVHRVVLRRVHAHLVDLGADAHPRDAAVRVSALRHAVRQVRKSGK